MVKKNDHVDVAAAIESFELRLGPFKLHVVAGDVRVERQHERVAVAERVGGIFRQPPRRSLGGNERGHGVQKIPQRNLPIEGVG